MMSVTYLAGTMLALLAFILWYRLPSWVKGVKGPWGLPFLGVAVKLAIMPLRDIYPWLQELIGYYGGTFQVNISGLKCLLIAEPKDAEVVLNSINYIQKGYEYFVLKPWLRDGLLLSSGDKWHQRRKLLTPTFHFKILEDSLGRLREHAERFAEHLLQYDGKPFRVESTIRSATLDVICDAALGLNMNTMDKQKNGYVSAIKSLTEEATQWFLNFWLHNEFVFEHSSLGKLYFKDVKTVQDFSEKVILKRKSEYVQAKNIKQDYEGEKKRYAFLDRLLELDVEYPGELSMVDIQEEVDTFTFEGHDTTAAALLFSIFSLANHQDVQERAFEEQLQIFGSSDRQPTRQDLNEMSYLEMVIKEVLRLYPPVPLFSRRLTEDLVLSNGSVVPPGFNVMLFPVLLHRNADYWPEPEAFKPERFLHGVERHPYAFLPFSAGPRNCIGQKFAMMEMKLMISTLLRRCKLQPVTTSVKLVPNVILTSEEPIYVRVLPRES